MTTFPKARRGDHAPSWLKAARGYYGAAFEAKKKTDLAEAMADWSEMDSDERGFVLAHLQYLNLLAQRDIHRLLLELRASVEVIGDEVIEAVELAGGEPDEELLEETGDEAIEDNVGDEDKTGGRHLELVEDTPIPEYEPEPREMPVEAVAPEMLRDADEERVIELPGIDGEGEDVEPPEGA